MKKILFNICFLFLVVLYLPSVSLKLSDDFYYGKIIGDICTEVIEEEPIIANTLTIKNLFVDIIDNGDTSIDDINWFNKGGTYYIFLPKVANREKIRVFFKIEKDVKVSAYDNDNHLVGKFKSGDEVDVFKYDNLVLKTDNQTKKSKSYKIAVMQSEVGSVFINLNHGDSDLKAIHASEKHTVSRTGYAMVADDNNNLTYERLDSMRGRGNVTWRRAKHPYQIKFANKVDIFDMGNAKTYNLLNNYMDGTLSRNYVILKFSRDLEIPYSLDAKPVDLYINNNYRGSYLLTEKVQVKKNRIEIDKNNFLFEIDNHPSGNDYIKTKKGMNITIKNPEFDEMNAKERAAVKKKAKAYLNKLESVIYNTKISTKELKKYIDFESFAKFYWLQEISLNFDAMRGSNYFYIKDGILYAGPGWDFDDSMNRSYYFAPVTGYYVLNNARLNRRIKGNWFRPLLSRKDFSDEVDKMYIKYRDVINDLPNEIETYVDSIKETTKMNYTRWSYATMRKTQKSFPWRSGDYSNASSINLYKSQMTKRVNFYEKAYDGLVYDYFIYSYKEGKNEVEVLVSDKNKLPLNYTKDVTIYGVYDGEVTKLNTTKITEDEVTVELNYTKKASSKYKLFNRGNYKIKFSRED